MRFPLLPFCSFELVRPRGRRRPVLTRTTGVGQLQTPGTRQKDNRRENARKGHKGAKTWASAASTTMHLPMTALLADSIVFLLHVCSVHLSAIAVDSDEADHAWQPEP